MLHFTTYIFLAVLQSGGYRLFAYFRIFIQTTPTPLLSPNRNEKVTYEKKRTQTTELYLARRRRRCWNRSPSCTQNPVFSTTSQADILRAKSFLICKICLEEISGFHVPKIYRSRQKRIARRTSNLSMDTLLEDIDDAELKQEVNSCNHFLVDSEIKKAGHSVFNFIISSSNSSFLKKKLDHLFSQLKCTVIVNLAVGFVLKNFEGGTCRYCYEPENSAVLERSNFVCTEDDLTNLGKKFQKMHIGRQCTKERANTKWHFHKTTNVTVFWSLLKVYPWVVTILFYLGHLPKTKMWIVLLSIEKRGNPTMATSVRLEHLLCNCMVMTSWIRKLQVLKIIFSLRVRKEITQNFKVFKWTIFQKLKTFRISIFSAWHRFCWWRTIW